MTQAQYESLFAVLCEIRDVLTAGVALADEGPEPEGCHHPDDQRVDLRTFTDTEHWICSACRYEHTGLTRN